MLFQCILQATIEQNKQKGKEVNINGLTRKQMTGRAEKQRHT